MIQNIPVGAIVSLDHQGSVSITQSGDQPFGIVRSVADNGEIDVLIGSCPSVLKRFPPPSGEVADAEIRDFAAWIGVDIHPLSCRYCGKNTGSGLLCQYCNAPTALWWRRLDKMIGIWKQGICG